MTAYTCSGTEQFWKQVEEIQARGLVVSVIGAAKAQIEYSRALSASKRAGILLGGNAGREHKLKAELHYRTRITQLRNMKQLLAQFAEGVDESGRIRIAGFFSVGGLKEVTAYARQTSVLSLLNSDLTLEDTRKAVESLDSTLEKIEGLTSFEEIIQYLNEHLDELIDKKMGNPDAGQGLCVLILILSSLLVVLILIAALICALTLGLACQGILQELIDQACPP